VTEGDDKPAKYPVMFRAADVMLVTKTDLLAVLDDFEPARAEQYLRQLANAAPVLPTSVKSKETIKPWLEWLHQEVKQHQQRIAQGESLRPAIQPDGMRLHANDHQHNLG
jgi:hydrogenase nickel incorporation protein HypB